jgi:UDP-N-acetylmuramoyl-L-alanyl-D-glutamate--2,6-diaminopimelate ligase
VFGAPGNRDKYKRPEMGKIADQLADVVIVTDDDPDTESRLSIIQEVAK